MKEEQKAENREEERGGEGEGRGEVESLHLVLGYLLLNHYYTNSQRHVSLVRTNSWVLYLSSPLSSRSSPLYSPLYPLLPALLYIITCIHIKLYIYIYLYTYVFIYLKNVFNLVMNFLVLSCGVLVMSSQQTLLRYVGPNNSIILL